MQRPAVLLLAAPLLATLSLGGCDSNPSEKARPSPLPYGYREPTGKAPRTATPADGEQLDQIVAVVWGEVLTRRRLVRETGGRSPGQDDATFEKSLATRKLRWAQKQLFVKAATLEGLHIPSTMLDDAVKQSKARAVEILSKNTGRPVTFDEYLAQQHLSEDEFRNAIRDDELQGAYLRKLRMGLGKGTRPQVDFAVSPAEVRRLYREQPELFDQPRAVTFALFPLPVVEAVVGDVTPAQAEAVTRQKAEAVAAAFRAGEDPKAIGKRLGLADRNVIVFDKPAVEFRVKEVSDWLFDPARRPRESTILEPPGSGGPVVLGLLTVDEAKKHTFEESYDDVVEAYRQGRALRLASLKVIEMVQGGAVAWPPELADALVDDARRILSEIDKDPRYARAYFR